MIIQKQQINVDGAVFNRLTHDSEYFACGYNTENVVVLFTSEENPLPAGTIVSSLLDGFGATSYQELIAEAVSRGLTFPE